MNRKQELRGIIDAAQKELIEIQEKDFSEENADKVGRFYKTVNAYSCPDRDSYNYMRVTGLTESYFKVFSFSVDHEGRVGIFPTTARSVHGCIEIDEDEYRKAWEDMLSHIASLGGWDD